MVFEADGCSEDLNLCKKPVIEEQVDRISNLHDCIIHHIFSFLSTLDVMKTSVLAKRWRYLWTMTPVLDFDDLQFIGKKYDFASFENFVHASYKATTIQGNRLSVQQTWVDFVVTMNTEELSIDSCSSLEMPCCGSLKDLKISLSGEGLKMPVAGCFSSLESLSLSHVTIENAILDLSSCMFPILKRLSLKKCRLGYTTVRCPHLEKMEIEQSCDMDRLTIVAEKLHTLYVSIPCTSLVEIIAPRLQTFKWVNHVLAGTFSFGNFTCLRDVDIFLAPLIDLKNIEMYVQNARSFLKRFACAETIHLQLGYMWGLSIQIGLLEAESSSLDNLKRLSVVMGPNGSVYPAISHLLKSCPNATALDIFTADDNKLYERGVQTFPESPLWDQDKEWKYQYPPLDNLLEASFIGFRGSEDEIEFIEFLLRNAASLKRIIIRPSFEDEPSTEIERVEMKIKRIEMELRMREKLRELLRTLPDVAIMFV